MTLPLPRAQSAYVDATGRPTTEFYKWLQSVERDSGGSDPALALAIRQIAEKLGSPDGSVAGIPNVYPGLSEDTSIVGIGGQIQVSGTLASGEAIIGLASVPDSGAGELLAITRDDFGRVSGSRATLPSDIPNPSWRFLIDPDGNYLTDPAGDLLRAPGYEFDEEVFCLDDLVVTKHIGSGGALASTAGLFDGTSGGLYVQRQSGAARALIYTAGAVQAQLIGGRSGGTLSAPTATNAGVAFEFYCTTYDGSAWAYPAYIQFFTTETHTPTARGTEVIFGTTSNGATNSTARWRMESAGNLLPNVTATYTLGNSGRNCLGVYSSAYYSGASQVVGARRTGWAAATGTATRTTFATGTVTLPQLAERVKALLDDLIAHGLIGA